jgi:CRISPR/Cas system Type II protein with McrA/HNH and RuvC-like nuclease domain
MKIDDLDKLYIYKRDKKECYFCKKPLEFNKITFDHYLPKSKKGTMDVFNLVICCKKCNKLKSNKIPEDYKDKILELFLQAVKDNKIRGAGIKMPQKELKQELLRINKFEDITEHFIFQSNEKRYYIKNNSVFKFVFVATTIADVEN